MKRTVFELRRILPTEAHAIQATILSAINDVLRHTGAEDAELDWVTFRVVIEPVPSEQIDALLVDVRVLGEA